MSVRTAELLTAIVLLLASVGLMVKSAELRVDWVEGSGPGAGAWPFWLAGGMALTCVATIVRWFLRITPESRSDEPFISGTGLSVVVPAVGGLLLLLIGSHYIGIYFSMAIFLLLFVRFFGRHGWPMSIALTIGGPVVIFLFFEWALKVPLPKAYSEPLFYPIYDLIY